MVLTIKAIKKYGIIAGGLKIILFFIFMVPVCVQAQNDEWKSYVEGQVIATPANNVPFWFRANQNGSIPLSGISSSFIGAIRRDYTEKSDSSFNWGMGLQVRGNVGSIANSGIIEGYIKAKASIFEIKAGRFNDIIGIVDTTLSSGAFSVSGNAFGIPQVQIGMPQYQYIPFTNQLFAIKGSYSVGITGEKDVRELYDTLATVITTKSYYQQNSIYVRLGKPNWRLSLFAGINHHVMLGDEKKIQGAGFDLSPVKTFIYAAIGKTFFPKNPLYNRLIAKVGNHIGSVDLSMQYEFDDVRLLAYRQNLYDIGAIGHLANLADGIHGISLTNKNFTGEGTEWSKILFEFVYTANQAGYYSSKEVPSGDEDYYNNSEYIKGWTYQDMGIGNPLLTTRDYTRAGLPFDIADDYFISNRVCAFHGGFAGVYKDIQFVAKATFSLNYGTFGTSEEGHSLAKQYLKRNYGIFGQKNQFSGYLEGNKKVGEGLTVGAAVAGDIGGLYYNSVGIIFKLRKTFN